MEFRAGKFAQSLYKSHLSAQDLRQSSRERFTRAERVGKAYSFSAHSSGKAVFRSAPNITKKTAENRIIRKLLVLEILSSELS